MIKVKEFSEDMVWDYDMNDWIHDFNGKKLEEYINTFLEENDVAVLDIRYFVLQHDKGEDESKALLLYNDRKPFEKE